MVGFFTDHLPQTVKAAILPSNTHYRPPVSVSLVSQPTDSASVFQSGE